MSTRKKPAPPDMGGLRDDWGKLTAMRRQEREHTPPPADPPPTRAAEPEPPEPTEERPEMTRRSWYVEKEAADAFAAAVDDIHFATRVPKHTVASRLLRAATAQAEEVTTELSHSSHACEAYHPR